MRRVFRPGFTAAAETSQPGLQQPPRAAGRGVHRDAQPRRASATQQPFDMASQGVDRLAADVGEIFGGMNVSTAVNTVTGDHSF